MLNGYANDIVESVTESGESVYVKTENNGGWYGSEQFPIIVETTEQYANLVELADTENENVIDVSNFTVIVKDSANTSGSFAETNKPTIINESLYSVNKLISALPESVTMPDAITHVARIKDAEKAYNALTDELKAQVVGVEKLASLVESVKGYDRIYKHDADDGTVIASQVPGGYSSTIGGTATTRQDDQHGNVLTVKSDADGKAALLFENFPSVERYSKLYFYVKVSVSCNMFLSDGVGVDGWGDNYKNSWNAGGYWCNANSWQLMQIHLGEDYVGTNFAIGFRTAENGFTFEISDIYGVMNEESESATSIDFGSKTMVDTGELNNYGKVYNLIQPYSSETDLGSIAQGALSSELRNGHDAMYFWVYNPNASDVTFELIGTTDWKHWANTTLKSQVWTRVDLTAEIISSNVTNNMVCWVSSGANTSGWQISPIYSYLSYKITGPEIATLPVGQITDTGTTNENGKVYNLTQQWPGGDTDIQFIEKETLKNALSGDYDSFYFYIYNPNASDVTFEMVGTTDWKHWIPTVLTAKSWTKITITPEVVESNLSNAMVLCVTSGASASGWQRSPVYLAPNKVVEYVYLDHADVKEVIKLINEIPENVTLDDILAIETAENAYNNLADSQKSQVANYSKLTSAKNTITNIEKANSVIKLIGVLNVNAVDEDSVTRARESYNALTDEQKTLVTNYDILEECEGVLFADSERQARINNVITLIKNLPDSVVMPDHLVFVTRIENANNAYNALSSGEQQEVTNYAKLRTLVNAIKGYETIHVQSVDSVNVIPSQVPNFTSEIGGTASMGYDGYYGDYITVTPDAGGKAALQYLNFPDVSAYEKLYFNVKVGSDCDIYLADGDGWGDTWHNTWTITGLWTGTGFAQKEFDLTATYTDTNGNTLNVRDIFASNLTIGLRTNTTGVSFAITNIIGYKPDLGEQTDLTFGTFVDSGTTNLYGTVYNLTQSYSSDTDLGDIAPGALNSELRNGHDAMYFWVYNPNASDVTFELIGTTDWKHWANTTLKSQAWTRVDLTAEIISSNVTNNMVCWVSSGANTSGWQISPIYSFSTGDAIDKVQARIDALNTQTPNDYQVELARTAFEALTENQKALIDVTNLKTCEEALYGSTTEFTFIENGATKYKIYYESTASSAVNFLVEQIENATGATLEAFMVEPQKLSNYRHAIVVGWQARYEECLQTPYTESGRAGYVIGSAGRTVFIQAHSADGYRLAVIKFLNEVLGYDMLSDDCVVYSKDGSTVNGRFSITGAPFDYRQKQTCMTESEVYGMGLQTSADIWVPGPVVKNAEGKNIQMDMHNTTHYLPTATYQSAHPSWYFTFTDSYGESRTDICPTAGGNATEFNAMVDALASGMLTQINSDVEQSENICLSIMDSGDATNPCKCSRCQLYAEVYGNAGFSAAWIELMNAVNAKVRESLPAGKVVNIAFLAYRLTINAPVNDDLSLMKRYDFSSGSAVETGEYLKCDEGVTAWVAPISASYAENFNFADNADELLNIKKWLKLSDSVYIWLYGTNFKYYRYPYNSWKASAENYKILYDLGVKAVWSQSNETEATAFSDLKGYIDSKFMIDVNADYETVLDSYFTNYFGVAGEKMRAMFDAIVANCEAIEANNSGLGRGIYDELEKTTGSWIFEKTTSCWTESVLQSLVTLCNEAKDLVNADTSLSGEQRTAILDRITKESLFPRYVLKNVYSATDSTFDTDCTRLGVTKTSET